MSIIRFLVALCAVAIQFPAAATDSSMQAPRQTVGEPPVQISVDGVSVERTLAEFMDVCLRPRWNFDELTKAVGASDFGYVPEHADGSSTALAWKSKRGVVSLNISPEFSQCALSVGSIQPRTGQQLLRILRPAVEAELGHPVQQDDAGFYLEWTDSVSGMAERITLENAGGEPKQAIWYVFDRTAPGVREQLEKLIQPRSPPK